MKQGISMLNSLILVLVLVLILMMVFVPATRQTVSNILDVFSGFAEDIGLKDPVRKVEPVAPKRPVQPINSKYITLFDATDYRDNSVLITSSAEKDLFLTNPNDIVPVLEDALFLYFDTSLTYSTVPLLDGQLPLDSPPFFIYRCDLKKDTCAKRTDYVILASPHLVTTDFTYRKMDEDTTWIIDGFHEKYRDYVYVVQITAKDINPNTDVLKFRVK
jgi:hypothetical protein